MSVELVRAESLEDLIPVLDSAHKYRRDHTSHRSTQAWAESLLEEREIDSTREVYLGMAQGKPVAVLELAQDDAGTLAIAQLIVAENARFLGYGRAIANWVDTLGHDVVSLGVASQNAGAIAFWESVGFSQVGRLGKGSSALILMERVRLAGTDQNQEPASGWSA